MTYLDFAGVTLTGLTTKPRQLRDCRGTRPTHWLLYPIVKDIWDCFFDL